MTEERPPQGDKPQVLPPDYTAPIGPEDDRGFVEFNPEEENGTDLHGIAQEEAKRRD